MKIIDESAYTLSMMYDNSERKISNKLDKKKKICD